MRAVGSGWLVDGPFLDEGALGGPLRRRRLVHPWVRCRWLGAGLTPGRWLHTRLCRTRTPHTIGAEVGVEGIGIGPLTRRIRADLLSRHTLLLCLLGQVVRVESRLFGLKPRPVRLGLRLLGRHFPLSRSQCLCVGILAEIRCLHPVVSLLLPAHASGVFGSLPPASDGHRDDKHDDDRHYDDPDDDPDPGIHDLLQFLGGAPTQRDISARRDLNGKVGCQQQAPQHRPDRYGGRMGALTSEEVTGRLRRHVGTDAVGLTWLIRTGGEVLCGALGSRDRAGAEPLDTHEIFRISSMTKPVTAVGALILVADGVLTLDDPIEAVLPELADRRVLRTPGAELEDTVPAERAVTVRDLLTSTLGWGMDFTDFSPTPLTRRWSELNLGDGPPAPGEQLPADEWLARAGALPLQYQPGQRWLYNTSSVVLGILVARASGGSLSDFLTERIFTPLEMTDTGFWVPPEKQSRFGPCYGAEETVYDPADGQWSAPPSIEGGDGGLVSTVADYARFAKLLQGRGSVDGQRILPAELVHAMTTNRLTAQQLRDSRPDPGSGWGFGLGVVLTAAEQGPSAGSYGWFGGLGSSWNNDPATCRTGVLLTNQMWTSPEPPGVVAAFEELIGHR